MPKLGCNGFSLFAEQMRPHLEEVTNKNMMKFNELMKAAGPYWEQIDDDEKRAWKDRAKDYKRSDSYQSKKKSVRIRGFDSKGKKGGTFDDAGGAHHKKFGNNGQGQMGMHGEGPRQVSAGPGCGGGSGSDADDPDFKDPMELPGPVHRSPIVITPPGTFRAFDLVDGATSDIIKLLEKIQAPGRNGPFSGINHIMQIPKHRRNIPPRMRAAGVGGAGDIPMTSSDTSGDSMDEPKLFRIQTIKTECISCQTYFA